MNAFKRIFFELSVILLCFDSRHPLLGVDGAVFTEMVVTCHPESANICYGQKTGWSPSPAVVCPDPPSEEECNTTYVGGWGWEYSIVLGLDEGITDPEAIEKATVITTTVTIEDDKSTCNARIGNDDCAVCSTTDCDEFGQIKYDCTNLPKGISTLEDDECVSADDFFYPWPLYTKGKVESTKVTEDISEPDADALEAGSSIVGHFGKVFLITMGASALVTLV